MIDCLVAFHMQNIPCYPLVHTLTPSAEKYNQLELINYLVYEGAITSNS